jgi:hypothetical protein
LRHPPRSYNLLTSFLQRPFTLSAPLFASLCVITMSTSLLSDFPRRYLLFVNASEQVCGAGGIKAHPPTMVPVHPVIMLSSSRITTLFISSTSSRGILSNVTFSPSNNTKSQDAVMCRDSGTFVSHITLTIKYTHF